MNADDPRHGTTRGFHQGCRDVCCNAARARYEKEGRLLRSRGRSRALDAIGAQRRIRALMRLGWTSTDIAQAAGWPARNYVLRIINGQKGKPTRSVSRATDEAIRAAYDRLSMRTPPPTPCRARTRTLAEKRAYPSPLAWDDETIDDPNAKPVGLTGRYIVGDYIDEAAVLRRMAGERITVTKAERIEVVRRLRSTGWTFDRIEEHTGLKTDRYIAREKAAA